jgi:hypothetical protein
MATYNQKNFQSTQPEFDHTYFDFTLRNLSGPNISEKSVPVNFRETRGSALIPSARDYYLTIPRFQISSFQLPILEFQIESDQPDINRGAYTVTLEYTDGLVTHTTPPEPVIFRPQQVNFPSLPSPPDQNVNGVQSNSEYYYVYDFHYMIDLVNEALERAMANLKTLVGGAIDTVEEPFMKWEEDKTATFFARVSHFDPDVQPTQAVPNPPVIKVFFNEIMYSLFSSFPTKRYLNPVEGGKHYEVVMKTYKGANLITFPSVGIDILIRTPQEMSVISQWSPVSSVVFISNSIPVNPNQLSAPIVYKNARQIPLTQNFDNFSNVVSDITSLECAYRGGLLYIPEPQYRLIDMISDSPVYTVDISLVWRDMIGLNHQIFLPPGASCSMKILFQRKDSVKYSDDTIF